MMKRWSVKRWLFSILAVALIVRMGLLVGLVVAGEEARFVQIDTESYEESAMALLEVGRFSVLPETPDSPQTVRTPGYPVFLAASYLVFGPNRVAVIAIQVLLGVLSIALVYRVGSTLWSKGAGLLAAPDSLSISRQRCIPS